jgi:trehalose 6-phosphate phosphatase
MSVPSPSHPLPHALELVPGWLDARARAGRIFVGLDFDGTLAPIVPHPDDAVLPEGMRAVLARLGARPDTLVAILSGRGLADVRARVDVPGLYFAGNHGLEIEGPGITRLDPVAAQARPELERIAVACRHELADVPGAIVEDKGASLSVHYRLVAERDARARVRETVRAIAAAHEGVRVQGGKMLVEVRPDVAWHKGAALTYLRRALSDGVDIPALFIGDDRTDEDAFRALGPNGWGIVVAEMLPAQPDTAARAWLRDPAEVADLLGRLDEGAPS